MRGFASMCSFPTGGGRDEPEEGGAVRPRLENVIIEHEIDLNSAHSIVKSKSQILNPKSKGTGLTL